MSFRGEVACLLRRASRTLPVPKRHEQCQLYGLLTSLGKHRSIYHTENVLVLGSNLHSWLMKLVHCNLSLCRSTQHTEDNWCAAQQI